MKPSLLELDPSGDTILVLKYPNVQRGEEIPRRLRAKKKREAVLTPTYEPEPVARKLDKKQKKLEKKMRKLEKEKRKREQSVTLIHAPEAALEPEPTIEPELAPEPEPTIELELALQPEPATESEPAIEPEPVASKLSKKQRKLEKKMRKLEKEKRKREQSVTLIHAAEPEPAIEPEPTIELEPALEPEPTAEPEPAPEPERAIELELAPEPEPTIELEPASEPELASEPEPAVDFELAAEPEPAPEPELAPEPENNGQSVQPEIAVGNEPVGESEIAARPGCDIPETVAESEPETRVEPSVDIVTDICALRELNPWVKFGEPTELRLRVSSAHLCLASPVFRLMFRGPFKKPTIRRDECYEISASDWDIEAFLVVLDIIHGHNRHVPRNISLELLAKVSTIVDYYDCQESVDTHINIWIPQLKSGLPSSYDEKVPVWLCISWVFQQSKIFEKMVELAVMQLQDLLVMTGIPFPQPIIGVINKKRMQSLEKMFQYLQDLQQTLATEPECQNNCQSAMLGSLIRHQHRTGIIAPHLNAPYSGFSVNGLYETLRTFTAPAKRSGYGYSYCSCSNLEDRMKPGLDKLVQSAKGIKGKELLGEH